MSDLALIDTCDYPQFKLENREKEKEAKVLFFKPTRPSNTTYKPAVSLQTITVQKKLERLAKQNNKTITQKSETANADKDFLDIFYDAKYRKKGWNGYSADKINLSSAILTHAFVSDLIKQHNIPRPFYSVAPNGEFIARWNNEKGQFIFSVSEENLCSYSGINYKDSEYLGSFSIEGKVDKIFLETIHDFV